MQKVFDPEDTGLQCLAQKWKSRRFDRILNGENHGDQRSGLHVPPTGAASHVQGWPAVEKFPRFRAKVHVSWYGYVNVMCIGRFKNTFYVGIWDSQMLSIFEIWECKFFLRGCTTAMRWSSQASRWVVAHFANERGGVLSSETNFRICRVCDLQVLWTFCGFGIGCRAIQQVRSVPPTSACLSS